jgi:hypothetical protein
VSITLRRRSLDVPASTSHDAQAVEVRRQLIERLHSLDEHCLQNLVNGVKAATNGDLTVEVVPVTNAAFRICSSRDCTNRST